MAAPILFAPMAQQRLCHPEGELAMARAAASSGLPYCLSTMATSSIQVRYSCSLGCCVGRGMEVVLQRLPPLLPWGMPLMLPKPDPAACLCPHTGGVRRSAAGTRDRWRHMGSQLVVPGVM